MADEVTRVGFDSNGAVVQKPTAPIKMMDTGTNTSVGSLTLRRIDSMSNPTPGNLAIDRQELTVYYTQLMADEFAELARKEKDPAKKKKLKPPTIKEIRERVEKQINFLYPGLKAAQKKAA